MLDAIILRRETEGVYNSDVRKLSGLLEEILLSSKKQIEKWQGRLVIVVIADRITCLIKGRDSRYQTVRMVTKKLKIDLIDTVPENCDDQFPNRFYSRGYSHFNHEGNQWLGKKLIDYVKTSSRR